MLSLLKKTQASDNSDIIFIFFYFFYFSQELPHKQKSTELLHNSLVVSWPSTIPTMVHVLCVHKATNRFCLGNWLLLVMKTHERKLKEKKVFYQLLRKINKIFKAFILVVSLTTPFWLSMSMRLKSSPKG